MTVITFYKISFNIKVEIYIQYTNVDRIRSSLLVEVKNSFYFSYLVKKCTVSFYICIIEIFKILYLNILISVIFSFKAMDHQAINHGSGL